MVSDKLHWIFSFVIGWVLRRETIFSGKAGLYCFYITSKVLGPVYPRSKPCIFLQLILLIFKEELLEKQIRESSDTKCFTTQKFYEKMPKVP